MPARLIATLLLLSLFCHNLPAQPQTDSRPNILWIYIEDMNNWMGCYGDPIVKTPAIDSLASGGVRFDRAYMPAGVCSATRSALITGTMQTTFGIHNHRSSRDNSAGKYPRLGMIHLPKGVKTLPQLFREAGYYTFNKGKDDYNFVYNRQDLYSKTNLKAAKTDRSRPLPPPGFPSPPTILTPPSFAGKSPTTTTASSRLTRRSGRSSTGLKTRGSLKTPPSSFLPTTA